MTLRRAALWLGIVALIELVARAVVYGMTPSGTARALEHDLVGPSFVITLVVALGLGAALSTLLVWAASFGIRERWALADDRPRSGPPRIAARRLVLRAAVLTLVGWLTFAAIETVIHLNAGMGFHGLECLVGPVHRNALPVIGGLALLASALAAVAALVVAWMRRTVGRFGAVRPALRHRQALASFSVVVLPRRVPLVLAAAPRGPPRVAA
jgi:hypothetical protein